MNVRKVNPFGLIRSDYADSRELLSTFVDPGERVTRALDEFMPVMVYGNRGTGKTTLAKHYSYEAAADALQREPAPADLPQHVGLYLRFDIDLLNSFNTRTEELHDRFDRLFASFFDVLVVRKALNALDRFGGLAAWCDVGSLFAALYQEFGEIDSSEERTLTGFKRFLDRYLSAVRRYLNNPEREQHPLLLQGNILMKLLVEQLLSTAGRPFCNRWFAVLIDEVEHFESYQQKVLNARVKQIKEQDRVTYRYFLRHEGLRTWLTLAVDSQPLQESHDFRTVKLDEGVERKHFAEHVSRIAERRLQLHGRIGALPLGAQGIDIEGLFASISPEDEARQLLAGRQGDKLAQRLNKLHPALSPDFREWFDREPQVLRRAVAYILLNQGKDAAAVATAFSQWTDQARDWYHNYHRAALHWLCRQYRGEKLYAGLDTLFLLSGSNVRYFLEYCRAIIDQWIASAEGAGHAALSLPIPVGVQDQAIRERAQFHVDDLRGRPRYAAEMLNLVKRLGGVFEQAHASDRQSQFEVNHFSVRDYAPVRHKDLETLLRECRMENVLLRRPGNKQKGLSDDRLDDWALHPCFAPYFNISPRRKKKLDWLTADDLRVLFKGSETEYKALFAKAGKQFGQAPSDTDPNMGLFDDE